MPTSAVGSKASLVRLKTHTREFHSSQVLACVQLRTKTSWRASLGFTLMELLVVIALIAIGTAAVSFTLRDTSQTLLERDAERLAALLESARARSRSSGVPVVWRPVVETNSNSAPAAFAFEGLPPQTLPDAWLSPQTQVAANSLLRLGPDPIIGPQSVMLSHQNFRVWVSTNGIEPFHVSRTAP
jgi:general secretion pathway protein H